MEVYDAEVLNVEKKNLLEEIESYVNGEGKEKALDEVEMSLLRNLLDLGQIYLKQVISNHEGGKLSGSLKTSQGDEVPFHSFKTRSYLSIFGRVEIKRAYYWREGEEGICPLDAKLNLPRRLYSYLLEKWMQARVAEEPYNEAVKGEGGIAQLLGLKLNMRGQQKVAREASTEVEAFYDQKPAPDSEGPMLCLSADCKGVRMVKSEQPEQEEKDDPSEPSARRKKGEKRAGLRRDAVVTSDFSFQPAERTPEEMAERLMHSYWAEVKKTEQEERALNKDREPLGKQVFATMYGKECGFRQLFDRVANRDPTNKKPIIALIDGERALEKSLLAEIDRRGWQDRLYGVCLDIIHVSEYVWEAATALVGERGDRESLVREWLLSILKGEVGRVIGGLRQRITKGEKTLRKPRRRTLEKVVRYLENHRHMMCYDEYLQKGFPIASGVVEGTCGSLVKDRTDDSGMLWTREGVQAVLNLRAVKKNGDWDDFWKYYMQVEKEKLYRACLN